MKEFKNYTRKQLKELYPDATESRLHYMKDLSQRKTDVPYKPRPRKDTTELDLIANGLEIIQDDSEESGYKIYQHGVRRPITLRKTGQYKNGGQKFHYYTYYNFKDENGKTKQRPVSLANIIMCLINHKDVLAGYVVDHIDNDSFNNNLDNLQILSIRDNAMKNPPVNYYWKKK